MLKGIKAIPNINIDAISPGEGEESPDVLAEGLDADIEYELLKGAKYAFAPETEKAARRLHEDGTKLFYTINGTNGKTLRDLAPVLQYVDYFAPSDADALELTATDNCAAALRELGGIVKTPVLNLGEQGALALVSGKPFIVPAVSSFSGGNVYNFLIGFMYGVNENADLEKCMQYANVVSALSDKEITEGRIKRLMREYR